MKLHLKIHGLISNASVYPLNTTIKVSFYAFHLTYFPKISGNITLSHRLLPIQIIYAFLLGVAHNFSPIHCYFQGYLFIS
jgi:hypothetical protein